MALIAFIRGRRSLAHVGLEDRVASGLDLGLGGRDKGKDEAVEGVLGAVVGVEGDGNGVVLGYLGDERGGGEGARRAVLDRVAGEVIRTTSGHLNDAVGAGLGQSLQDGVDGGRRRNVDRGVGKAIGLGFGQHLGILLWGCDGHCVFSSCFPAAVVSRRLSHESIS
jgi:hypothetical protein